MADLADLTAYIRADNPVAARRVAERILTTVRHLPASPRMGTPDPVTGARKLFLPGLPYVIPYRIKDNTLLVLRVYHMARRWPAHGEGA
ncbi:MAG: type II toxin-antitoxin system RelE/ParE family toxin [Magnetococcales bacterium]|nr:type II toxin-antitoxin system RelE/ParE family toxin [Magnetococcales bacterium]